MVYMNICDSIDFIMYLEMFTKKFLVIFIFLVELISSFTVLGRGPSEMKIYMDKCDKQGHCSKRDEHTSFRLKSLGLVYICPGNS